MQDAAEVGGVNGRLLWVEQCGLVLFPLGGQVELLSCPANGKYAIFRLKNEHRISSNMDKVIYFLSNDVFLLPSALILSDLFFNAVKPFHIKVNRPFQDFSHEKSQQVCTLFYCVDHLLLLKHQQTFSPPLGRVLRSETAGKPSLHT